MTTDEPVHAPEGITVRRSPSVAKLAQALVAARATIKSPVKNRQNPHLKNWYADLAAVLEAVLPALTAQKLAVVQLPCEHGAEPALMTLLLHESGEWLETTTRIRPVKNDPQAIGSAQSYAKRYALQSLLAVAAEDDDDGHAASQPAKQAQQAQKPAQAPAKPATATGDPVTDRSAFAALLAQKKRSWSLCIEWLNAHCKPAQPYVAEGNERTIWLDVPLEHRQKLVADLRTMPDVEAATTKG